MFKRGLLMALVGVLASAGLAVAVAAPAQAAPPAYVVVSQVQLPAPGEGIAVDPVRGLVYVANRAAGSVFVLDEATMTVQATIPVPDQPFRLAVGPTGFVYVSQYTGTGLPGSVAVINPTTRTVVASVPTGNSPLGVTVSRDGTRLWVGNGSSALVSVFDVTNPAAPAALPALALSQVSELVTEGPTGLLYISTDNNSVFVVDPATGTTVATWAGLSDAHQVMISADGTHAFVSQQLGSSTPIFDLATNTASGSIPVANSYYQSADPSQGAGFITQPFTAGGSVAVIDSTTGALSQTLPGVTGAYATATDPTTHLTFVTRIGGNTLTKIKAT
jgi:YVTN family beta-propeller protein